MVEMHQDQRRATVLMSGGVDSAACAYLLNSQRFLVDAAFVDYGQAAGEREFRAACALADHLGISIRRLQLSGSGSHEAGEVIGRNAFLIFAVLLLTGQSSNAIAIGLHGGTPYFDSSRPFVASISNLIAEHTDGQVALLAPFIDWTKQDVYAYFSETKIPLALTYSCEAGTEPVCGECLSCRDRKTFQC